MANRSKENAVDWDALERQYRLGKKSNKQLGAEFDVDPSSIGKRAKRLGWVADKSKDVDVATNALLIQSASGNSNPNSTPTAFEVKVAAQTNADIILAHRSSLRSMAAVEEKLLRAVEAAVNKMDDIDEFFAMAKEAFKDDPIGGGDVFRGINKLLGRSALIDDYKRLVEAAERRRNGERQAFNIVDGVSDDKGGVEAMLKRLGSL